MRYCIGTLVCVEVTRAAVQAASIASWCRPLGECVVHVSVLFEMVLLVIFDAFQFMAVVVHVWHVRAHC